MQEASHGVLRLRGRLDHLLGLHLEKGISSLSSLMLDLLRLGAYQLLYMDGIPAYAAVSQTVDQAREVAGGGGARLANGVLRSLEREGGGEERFPSFDGDPLGYLSTWGSHPSWMVARWLERWSADEVRRLVEGNNVPPPLFFRPLGHSPEEGAQILSREGWSVTEVEGGAPCLLLEGGTDPAQIMAVLPGIVQDPGAALVTVYADVPRGERVADLCAAPGGKALALSAGGARVLAADRSLPRLRVLRENRDRLGLAVELVAGLAQAPPLRGVPFVLLDVPCSGTGTLRRHPDARWRLTLDTLARLAELQRKMLGAAGELVPPGGYVVYSTCTLEPEENGEQVERFLREHEDFALEETGVVDSRYLDSRGRLMVLPHKTNFDGAFCARLVRVPGKAPGP